MLLLCALVAGSRGVWADTATKTEGFETATADGTYNSTKTFTTAQSDCGIAWKMYYGTVSTNDKISDNNSAQMRYYASATSNYPYITNTTPVYGLTNVSFKARTDNTNMQFDVSYSTNGTDWIVQSAANTFTSTGSSGVINCSVDLPSGSKYVKIGVTSGITSPASGKNYKLIIDNVVFTYTTHALALSASNGSITVLDGETEVENGSQVAEGVTLNISASGDAGYAFDGWSVSGTGSSVGSTSTASTTFTMGTADATLTAAFVADATEYTVTCNDASNGNVTTDITSALSGTTITLTITPSFRYYTESVTVTDANSNDVIVTKTGANTYTFSLPASNVTVDAVFDNVFGDALNVDMTGVTGNTYTDWSGVSSNSTAVYAGNTAKGNGGIQMRKLTDSKGASGIYTTASGGYARKVTVSWISNTTDARKLQIYGSNSAFSSLSDISNGTDLGTIVKGTSTELEITGNYQFIGMTAPDGAIYLAEIDIEWEQATTATITLASACTDGTKYYGTYSNGNAFVVPEGLTVSEISVIDNELLVEDYATGDVVPANTGVLMSATTAGDKTITLSAEAGTSVLGEDNMLKPSGDAGITAANMTVADTKFYRLTMHNGTTIGFWWGAADGAAFDLAANKAYLAVPTGATAPTFFWFGGETTGIDMVHGAGLKVNGSVFNLNGQRVAQPTKGLYIVNGKKIIIK